MRPPDGGRSACRKGASLCPLDSRSAPERRATMTPEPETDPHPRQDPHRRFRLPGDAAHRAARARGGRLSRDRAVPEGRGGLPRDEAEGRDPLRRAGLGDDGGLAARAAAIFEAGVPVFGICYGQQAMAAQLGGEVEGGHTREFGRAEIEIRRREPAVRGRLARGRELSGLDEPRRPRDANCRRASRSLGRSQNAPFAVGRRRGRATSTRVQFHPEVVHTPHGALLIRNFVRDIAGCAGDWTMGLPRRGDRSDPRAGRQRPRDLRPLRRRRFAPSPRC